MAHETTADRAIRRLNEVQKIFLKKLHDYGTDDLKKPDQIIQRIEEKIGRINRLRNLEKMGEGVSVTDESIADTATDIIGYGLILSLMLHNEWGDDESLFRPGKINDVAPAKDWRATLINHIQACRTKDAQEHPLPEPKKPGDVGYDLYTVRDTVIPHNTKYPIDVPTEMKIKLPEGHYAVIINRSSTPRKLGIEVVPGVIDTGYTGELYACCWNRTGEDIIIPKGARLAQFLIFKSLTPPVIEVDKLPETARGESGFGSTDYETPEIKK